MTREQLAGVLAKKAKITRRQAENIITAFGTAIKNALENGDKVVYSNFGTFYTVHYPSKIILHPKYGAAKKIIMLPTNVAKWMPSENIKQMVNKGLQIENPTMHGKKRKTEAEKQKIEIHDVPEPDISVDKGIEIPIKYLTKTETQKPAVSEQNSSDPKPNNIYEDLMRDDSKAKNAPGTTANTPEEQKQSIWSRFVGNKDESGQPSKSNAPKENSTKDTPPVGSGIFEKNVSQGLPDKKTNDQPIKIEATSEPNQTGTPTATKAAEKTEEDKLTPFPFPISRSNITYVDLSKTIVPKEVLQTIPEKVAKKLKAVPIEEKGDELVVAMIDPEDIEVREIIKRFTQKKLAIKLATEADINHVLDQYQGLESEVEEAIETNENENDKKNQENKKALIESTLDDAPAARIVSSLLKRAIRDKASDIHIEPQERDVQVRFRVDGILRKKVTLPKNVHLAVISRVKILASLKIDEQRLPQDGRFSINIENHRVDFRVSTMPTAFGEKIVMRVLDKAAGILTVEQLGLLGSGLETLTANLDKSHGMILVTGPTGSGKTTTLYALIDKLYTEGVNIITLEDPIEYQMPGINQSQVNHEIDYTFASGLRSIVRQDPDIIMIGEIRDSETAEMAVQAALTGHVVLSTLHTNDAAGAAPRLLDMKVEPFLLTSSVNLIIGQRLARKICDDCKEEKKVNETELKTIDAIIASMPEKEKKESSSKTRKFYHGKGCKNCGDTGYKGRIGIFEVMAATEPVKEMILQKSSSTKIQAEAIKQGMVTMIQDGIIKALSGATTLEEVWRVTKD